MKLYKHLLIQVLLLLIAMPAGAELAAKDIIVVYNGNMKESKSVARYYVKKRGIPEKNLLSVNVSDKEAMSRNEYEKKLVPPVMKAIENLQSKGQKASVLLVYGIPLKIKETKGKKEEANFKNLASDKVKEHKKLVLEMTMDVESLIGKKSNQTPGTTKDIIERGDRTAKEALEFIARPPTNKEDSEKSLTIASILFRLTGLSSVAREIERKYSRMKMEDRSTTRVDGIVRWNAIIERQLSEVRFYGVLPESANQMATSIRITRGVMGELIFWNNLLEKGNKKMTSSSVDNELSMVMAGPYHLNRWLGNPLNKIYDRLPGIEKYRGKVIMVGRLDGPTPHIARRLVDHALEIEEKGLEGIFYIDARGIQGEGSYGKYDGHLYTLYDIVNKKSQIKTVFDDKDTLFPSKCCKDAALYVGWYSLGKYIDSFEWNKGAVAFHVASSEAATLRKKGSQVWVKRMLEEGVAASIGPVEEPYLDSFPLPHIFFPMLMSGEYSLLEAYYQSTPYLSWRQLVIGDPLYRPFKKNPAIRLN